MFNQLAKESVFVFKIKKRQQFEIQRKKSNSSRNLEAIFIKNNTSNPPWITRDLVEVLARNSL